MKFSLILITILLKCFIINASNIDYSKCLETKVYCQSLPENCIRDNSECNSLLIASPVIDKNAETGVQFELFGKIDKNGQYFAMGLSTDTKMGDDSVTDIYISNDGKHQEMRQSWNSGKSNQVINGAVDGISQIGDVVNKDGILSAKWIRKAVTEVHSNRFDIINTKYYIMLANGPIDANNNKKRHSERSVSQSAVDLQFSNDQALKDMYTNCKKSGTENICLGLPSKCMESEKCDLALAITKTGYGMSEGTVSFQLIGKPDDKDSGWIASALSDDNSMGSDSVVECLLLSNSKTLLRNSWNDDSYDNQVIGDVPGIVQTGPVVYDGGKINCKWTRTQITKVNNVTFDLKNKKYYLLIAKGPIDDQNKMTKGIHSVKTMSGVAYSLETQQKGTTTTSGPITTTPTPSVMSEAYDRCHKKTRLCFGVKTGDSKCLDKKDCTLLFSSFPKAGGDVQIELYWNRGSSSGDSWAAVALSEDQRMGEDIVTECIVTSKGNVELRGGWNPSGHNPTNNVNDSSITSLETSFSNGIVSCKWNRKVISTIEGHDFNIKNSSYYLLVGYGPLSSDEKSLRRHSYIEPSSEKVSLQSLGILKSAGHLNVQLHATFMIVGWLGCVGIAILLARHYKNSWPDSTLCGVKLWFAFHRSLMICGVVLVLASTIIIFIDKKGWVGASAHPIVGLTSIILCFLQPIGALFRPNPDSPKRWLFNYLHWSGGYIGYLLSFVAICLSTNFSNLFPEGTLWVLIAYIIVYILSHVLHHLKTLLMQKQNGKDIQTEERGRETLIDLTLALLNFAIIMAFVLALVILLFI